MISSQYRTQADLILQIIPIVSREEIFALDGGSAINLFIRDMPRLSVDLDLKYLLIDDRSTAIRNITEGLNRIKRDLEKTVKGISVGFNPSGDRGDAKLNCQLDNAQIKVEVNTVIRGHIEPVHMLTLRENVQKTFGKFAEIQVVSLGELYGGKICAALDRQHPRDLFDIKLLLEDQGITEAIKTGFLALLISHARPIHEVLSTNLIYQRTAFEKQFTGMTDIPFTYEDFEQTRIKLMDKTQSVLTEKDRKFLLSFKKGQPKLELFPSVKFRELPAVRWKLQNNRKLINADPEKHKKLLASLEKVLSV